MDKVKAHGKFLQLLDELDSSESKELILEIPMRNGQIIRISVSTKEESGKHLYLCKEEGDD